MFIEDYVTNKTARTNAGWNEKRKQFFHEGLWIDEEIFQSMFPINHAGRLVSVMEVEKGQNAAVGVRWLNEGGKSY